MKLVKKWLFPVLTCLIVVGAAVLPQRISQARDARQFGQVHTELLAANSLPTYEPPSLLDRLILYARWSSGVETIPSVQSPEMRDKETAEQLTREALERLAEGGVVPGWLAEGLEITSWSYNLLWDPESGIANQKPITFWKVSAEFGSKTWVGSLWMDVDAESGLPLGFSIYHDNMAQWLPYETDAFQQRVDRYLALLGLDTELIGSTGPETNSPLALDYAVEGTNIGYWAGHNVTMFNAQPSITYGETDSFSICRFDG